MRTVEKVEVKITMWVRVAVVASWRPQDTAGESASANEILWGMPPLRLAVTLTGRSTRFLRPRANVSRH